MGGEQKTFKEKLYDKLLKDSIFAVLFVTLLFYVMNDSKQREQQYQDTIKTLSQSIYAKVENSDKKIDEILRAVYKQ